MRRSAPEPLVCRRLPRAGRRVRSVAKRRRIRCPASSSIAIPGGGNTVCLCFAPGGQDCIECVGLTAARPLRRACRQVSRAKRSAMISSWFYQASQLPVSRRKASPALLWMSGHRLRSVRFSPTCGEVRAYAEPSLSLIKRCEAKAGRRTERSEAGRAHRSGCSRSARSPSGAEWRSRGAAAEPPHAKRCALRRLVAQCAFERSGVLPNRK